MTAEPRQHFVSRLGTETGLLGLGALLLLALQVITRYDFHGWLLLARLLDGLLVAAYLYQLGRVGSRLRPLVSRSPVSLLDRLLAGVAGVGVAVGLVALLWPEGQEPTFWGLTTLSGLLKWLILLSCLRLAFILRTGYLLPGSLRTTPLSPALLVAGSFALVITTGTVLLCLPLAAATGLPHDASTALFTATSATCVTGLIVVDTPSAFSPFGHLTLLLLMQVGGLGIMTFSVLFGLLAGRRFSLLQRLVVHDTLILQHPEGLAKTLRAIAAFVFVIEAIGAALLTCNWWLVGMPLPEALRQGVFHAVSAFNNAGFSLFPNSLENWVADPVTTLVVVGLIVLGGLGFPVVTDLSHYWHEWRAGRRAQLTLHTRLVLATTGLLTVGGIVLLLALEWNHTLSALPFESKLLAAVFQSVTPRTAGFNTLPMAQLAVASQFLLVVLMFIGASPGSTGGGIKTTTLGIIVVQTLSMLRDADRVHLWRRAIPEGARHRAFAIALLFLTGVLTVTLLLTITEGTDLMSALFETTSAFGTVGLSLGLTPYLSQAGRLLLVVAMYVGRIGPLTLALSIRRTRREGLLSYPDGEVMVG
jgi:trk system potassium uptake protein TrkH